MTTILHWFRHDLRLADNRGLSAAAAAGAVVPVFILDERAAGQWTLGGASRWWLHHSLARLDAELRNIGSRLILRRGAAPDVLAALASETGATCVHWSRAYEPWAGALDQQVRTALSAAGVECRQFRGALLVEPEAVRTATGSAFKVYTPFAKACRAVMAQAKATVLLPKPRLSAPERWPASETLSDWDLLPLKPDWSAGLASTWQPGEPGAAQRLSVFLDGPVGRYHEQRDFPALAGTSRLSPHLHFGEISPLACWQATARAMAERPAITKGAEKFANEILWREFSAHLLVQAPHLPEENFRPEFASFPWSANPDALKAWRRGQTGYPIVDAGMRELWHTGWMHNRVRMIVASFLIKDLLIPWQTGERWFWDTLVDADLASNAAGWQWVAGSGADAAPFFRIFNPVTQGQKFDPGGDYVRRYVPELAGLDTAHIHAPWLAPPVLLATAGIQLGRHYPLPIVDHAAARELALAAFQQVTKG